MNKNSSPSEPPGQPRWPGGSESDPFMEKSVQLAAKVALTGVLVACCAVSIGLTAAVVKFAMWVGGVG